MKHRETATAATRTTNAEKSNQPTKGVLNMGHKIECDLQTREGFIDAIKQAGNYIRDHASNLLGEYPSLLCEMDIVATFRFDELPCIEVKRRHICCHEGLYPQNSADVDTLEKICRDMYREIEEHDAKHPDEVPTADDTRALYGDRLRALGVVL